jgi:hypothetical protein
VNEVLFVTENIMGEYPTFVPFPEIVRGAWVKQEAGLFVETGDFSSPVLFSCALVDPIFVNVVLE